jgi:hypothetical protein
VANWTKKDGDLRGDCVERGCEEGARSGSAGTALSGKELLKWLAEIWLDPGGAKEHRRGEVPGGL